MASVMGFQQLVATLTVRGSMPLVGPTGQVCQLLVMAPVQVSVVLVDQQDKASWELEDQLVELVSVVQEPLVTHRVSMASVRVLLLVSQDLVVLPGMEYWVREEPTVMALRVCWAVQV